MFRSISRISLTVLAAALLPASLMAQDSVAALRQAHCTACHPIRGEGANIAPDLARRPGQPLTPTALAALLWNHGPSMWKTMNALGISPELSEDQVRDIYAWFYGLRFFDPPGDAGRGKRVFDAKGCRGCHALSGSESKPGPPVSAWAARGDLLAWVSAMWHHSAPMAARFEAEGLRWPQLTEQEMTDLLVYLRSLRRDRHPEPVRMGSAVNGRTLFQAKGCAECHSLNQEVAGKIDLSRASEGYRGLIGIGAAMWNHRPQMEKAADQVRQNIAALPPGEMSDLLAYLWLSGYGREAADPQNGARLFQTKGCASCHREGGTAPRLTGRQQQLAPWNMSAAFWSHGPAMLKEMENRGIAWPVFTASQMRDLIAWLNGD